PPTRLRLALIAEVLLVALVGGTLGMWLGGQLAAAMADGFRGTLQGLFSVNTLAGSAPTAETWLGMVLILAVVVAWACADLLLLRRAQRGMASVATWRNRRVWQWLVALLVAGVSVVALLVTGKLWLIFLSTLGCLIGVGLLLPELLNWLLARAERHCQQPLLEWSCSEMRALCRLLQLPLTALAFAIATAIGVQAMVTGFESTFGRWLDQRLQGDLYLDPRRAVDTEDLTAKLQALPGVKSVLPMVRGRGVLGELAVDVMAVDPASPLLRAWPFLNAVSEHWSALAAGDGVMINEQLARRRSLTVGDRVTFRLGAESLSRKVLGIYADYGRPEGELLLPIGTLPDVLPDRYTTFVLGTSALNSIPWRDWPAQYPWLAGSRLRDQAGLKQAANAAFDRTFQMTRMLNTLTLVLAGTALALMGLVIFRLRQASYTLLHVYGVPLASLRRRLIVHSMLVTGLLALLATPMGIFLGWVLVARLNPAAFGWALPLHLYPGFWLQVWLACLLIGALVGVLVGNPVRLESLKNE
uniref:ABC transporter permease n=1 Tax=uncultured Microbulbifer sp. TaxID=348147 RepID=UPI0025DA10A8